MLPSPLSAVFGVSLALLLATTVYAQHRIFGTLDMKEAAVVRSLKERRSLLPFAIMYCSSATYVLMTFFVLLGKALIQIWKKVRQPPSEKACLILSTVAWTLSTLFALSRWERVLLVSLDDCKHRSPDTWWASQANVSIFPTFSRSWWRSVVEIYADNLSMAIVATSIALGLLILENIIVPTLCDIANFLTTLYSKYMTPKRDKEAIMKACKTKKKVKRMLARLEERRNSRKAEIRENKKK